MAEQHFSIFMFDKKPFCHYKDENVLAYAFFYVVLSSVSKMESFINKQLILTTTYLLNEPE